MCRSNQMRRDRYGRVRVLIGVCVLTAVSPAIAGENPYAAPPSTDAAARVEAVYPESVLANVDSVRAAKDLLADALRAMSKGDNLKRDECVAAAVDACPDLAAAHWCLGEVRLRGKWVDHEDVPETLAEDGRRAEYLELRNRAPDTIPGHLALATWCAAHGLSSQARAHAVHVVTLEPDHLEARGLLGHRKVNGVWASPADIEAFKADSARLAMSLRKWLPRIESLCDKATDGTMPEREEALRDLRAINDPEAIPAIERALCPRGEGAARTAVDILARIEAPDAAAALCRLAVKSPFPDIRRHAATKLSSRAYEQYVPMLLAALVMPTRSSSELYRDASGCTVFRQVVYREGRDDAAVEVRETEYPLEMMSDGDNRRVWQAERSIERALDARDRERALQEELARENARIRAFNDRVSTALAISTDTDEPLSPEEWWDRWDDYNEVTYEDKYDKPVDRTYDWTRQRNPPRLYLARPDPGPRLSCFAAGTLVWTDVGLKRIDGMEVGDLVLSQDVETGRLSYKPVLETTIRQPTQLLRLETENDVIECTAGHPFWLAGKGWAMARQLSPDSYLHGVRGAAQLVSIEDSNVRKAYNLVVADYHTYFVGQDKILCHDNTDRAPTITTAPGLDALE